MGQTYILVPTGRPALQGWAWHLDPDNFTVGGTLYSSNNPNVDHFTDAAGDSICRAATDLPSGSRPTGNVIEMSIDSAAEGFGTWGGRMTFGSEGLDDAVKGDEIWMYTEIFWPTGFDYDGSPRLKFMRLRTESSGGSNEGYNDWYIDPAGENTYFDGENNVPWAPHPFIKEQQDVWYRDALNGQTTAPDVSNTWETYEFYLKLDDLPANGGGTGRLRMWKDGALIREETDIEPLNTATSEMKAALWFTFWNGGSPATQSLYVKNLKVQTRRPSNQDASGNYMIGAIGGVSYTG
jgi:hypothetical protein